MKFFINIIIAMIISSVSTAIITYILSLKYEKKDNEPITEISESHENIILNPVYGNVIPLTDAKDEVFASGALGNGVVIEPKKGKVFAPFDGKILSFFPTKHAIALVSNDGIEVLIHVGINTVELNGKYFNTLANQGEIVKVGQPLLEFDIDGIEKSGYSSQTMVIITNSQEYESIEQLADKETKEIESLLIVR